MQRKNLWLISSLGGCLFLILGLVLLINPGVSLAQDDEGEVEPREYMGVRECRDCHGSIARFHAETPHGLALIDAEDEDNVPFIVADFDSGEDVRTVQFPDEGEPRPFTLEDIRYAIGAGLYAQRYLYEVGEDEYQVLPAEWNTVTGEWQPYERDSEWPGEAYDWVQNCAFCHTTGLNVEDGTWEEDGVLCETCHGPGSEHIDIVDRIREIPDSEDRADIEASINMGLDARTCGQCHSLGTDPTSGLPYPKDYLPGGALLTDDVFELVPPDDSDHWWATGQASHPNMQFNEWNLSGHTGAFAAIQGSEYFQPACMSCHNVTYAHAARVLARLEAEDDRDRLEILYYDEADLDVDNVGRADWEDLQAETITALGIDPAVIDPDQPFLPQTLPYWIARLQEEGKLEETAILPQSLADAIEAAGMPAAEGDVDSAMMFSVTCASCHQPHSETDLSAADAAYNLCVTCHQSGQPVTGVHHPVQEMFEGQAVVENVEPVPGVHFTEAEGPRCVTCHMPEVPVEDATRASHVMQPIMPGAAVDVEAVQDSCTGCHGDLVNAQGMQDLIDSIQSNTHDRLETIHGALTDDSPEWVQAAVSMVEGDGSAGIHNYAYTNQLLSAAERELGLSQDVAPLVLPEVLVDNLPTEVPLVAQDTVNEPQGLTTASLIFLIICGGILAVGAYAFFFRGSNS